MKYNLALTNHQQSIALLISAILIGVGATDPLEFGAAVRLILVLCGAVGFAIKEWVGGK